MATYLTANESPGQHASSWYAESAGPMPERPRLEGTVKADVAVVGAGYAGLSTALHLAEQGYSVAVVEANRAGWGASGRNGGQVGIGPRADIRDYERSVGPDDARKIWDISVAANQLVKDLVARHGIDCDLTPGYLEAAWRPGDVEELHSFGEHVRTRYGHDHVSPVDKSGMAEMLGTERYHGGLLDGLGAHLHPLKFALGLARAAEMAGATIYERSPVTALDDNGVTTLRGRVEAGQTVLACNGYIDGLEPRAAARSLPINNYIIATEPLGENMARALIRDNLCVCDTKFVLDYYRLSADHRMLWGGGESYGTRFPADIAAMVKPLMARVFPQLADVEITHAWGGTLAVTAARAPAFQKLGANRWAIHGWSGSGIHMASMGGQILAEAIAGETGRWDVLARVPGQSFPGGDWFRKPLMTLAMVWYGLRDRLG